MQLRTRKPSTTKAAQNSTVRQRGVAKKPKQKAQNIAKILASFTKDVKVSSINLSRLIDVTSPAALNRTYSAAQVIEGLSTIRAAKGAVTSVLKFEKMELKDLPSTARLLQIKLPPEMSIRVSAAVETAPLPGQAEPELLA